MDGLYDNLIAKISSEFSREIERMNANYNFDLGDEFEIAICVMLKKILPKKYGIVRGFVVDKLGNKEGDDIIIFDQELFPTLRFLENNDEFSRKQEIPIEAVYAYIEAKNTLDKETIEKAFNQIKKVKTLCLSRVDKSNLSFHSTNMGIMPNFTNPVYTMILAKNAVDTKNKQTSNCADINDFLFNFITTSVSKSIYNPESIVAGYNNIALCGEFISAKSEGIEITRFNSGSQTSQYQVNAHLSLAYGLGLAHLMTGLNVIKLGLMPWDEIFNKTKMPDEESRNKLYEELNNKNTNQSIHSHP